MEAGHSRAGEKLWSLTPQGLEAAAAELGRPVQEIGGLARGVGRTGAPHALCVGETIWTLSRPAPDLTRLQDAPHGAVEAARAEPVGFGTVESWATEVPLPATGTWATAGRGGAQADAVLTVPEAEVPLLFVEVDTCHMDAQRIATKLGKYARFLRRRVKDVDGRPRAMWRTRWEHPDGTRVAPGPLPPLLLVFHRLGPRSPESSWELVADRTRLHWAGRRQREDEYQAGGFHDYDDKIPLLFITIDALRDQGPTGRVFHRAGRDQPQTSHDAIGNPRRDLALACHWARDEERARQYQVQQEAAHEAKRPACTECGARFTNERWTYTRSRDAAWDEQRHLCAGCVTEAKARTLAEREAAEREACQRCRRRRQDDQPVTDPALRHAPPPDGVHCAACRQELNPQPDRGRLARRFLRGS
ncbi:replication-relaxation family protein [Streptomyces sp. SBT349]|uniref:replication-relaxation family protein n=1 Tax=Streptomyces sp. SBT349 TaxID=1580539 RepID=UPI00069E3C63|nr:replication-relaxation family protein [Streptomyces sp. SBT349]